MAVAPDLGPGARRSSKGIVLRHRAVGPDADDGAGGIGEILRARPVPSVAEGDEKIAVAGEREAPADLLWPRTRAALEDDRLVGERAVVLIKLGAQDADGGSRLVPMKIGQVDETVFLEVGIDRDIEQTAMADVKHAGNAGDFVGLGVRSDMLKPPGPFG